jgi:hypothetical protein
MAAGPLERLAAAGIQLLSLPGVESHCLCERGGFAALVERTPDGFGSVGGAGLLTEAGFAALIWRGRRSFFVRKGFEQPASEEQVDALRRFAAELEAALR